MPILQDDGQHVQKPEPVRAKTLVCHEDFVRSAWLSVDRRLTAHERGKIQSRGVLPKENLEQRTRWLQCVLKLSSTQVCLVK